MQSTEVVYLAVVRPILLLLNSCCLDVSELLLIHSRPSHYSRYFAALIVVPKTSNEVDVMYNNMFSQYRERKIKCRRLFTCTI